MVDYYTAIPTLVTDLLSGTPVTQDNGPTVIELPDGTIAHKIRLYGIAVSSELVIDDGTGSILVRGDHKVSVGDPILVIGRPRTYNNQVYILGEIIKKIDPAWIQVQKQQKRPNTKQTAINTIRELDSGEGADYTQVITKIGDKGEELITHLLATGELFETRPGKLKILE